MITGFGMGFMFSTALNAGTYGVAPYDAGVASASVNTGQQLGGSIGTSLLNTIAASATTSYIAAHIVAAGQEPDRDPGAYRPPGWCTGTPRSSGGAPRSSWVARSCAAR